MSVGFARCRNRSLNFNNSASTPRTRDLLITLKMLVLQRARIIGHDELAKKFDLKTLRGIGFVMMEQVKEKCTSNIPDLAHSTSVLDGCNLLNCSLDKVLSYEELKTSIGSDNRKRPGKRSREKQDGSVKI